MNRVGMEISKLRKEKGMTQKQLAKLVGVTEKVIIELEAGRRILNSELSTRISKALRQEAGKFDSFEVNEKYSQPEPVKKPVKVVQKPVQDVWSDALAGVIMSVPVYEYDMEKAVGTRKMPIISNKVEGFPKDKVFFLIVEDNEMIGFRIAKGDCVLAHTTQEIVKNAIFFVEYNGKRKIRQINKLEGDKLLLVSNEGSLKTETLSKKDVKILAQLIRVEIML